MEYFCCWLPVNPEDLVEAVSKAPIGEADLEALGLALPAGIMPERRRAFPLLGGGFFSTHFRGESDRHFRRWHRGEEQFRKDIEEALAAKERATGDIQRRTDKPFERLEAEVETEDEQLVHSHMGKLVKKIK